MCKKEVKNMPKSVADLNKDISAKALEMEEGVSKFNSAVMQLQAENQEKAMQIQSGVAEIRSGVDEEIKNINLYTKEFYG
jgi:hypothetical protein